MNSETPFHIPRRETAKALAIAWGFGLLVVAGLLYVWFVEDISIGLLLRDPADSTDGPTYLGAVSSLGFALWAASAAVCLLVATVLHSVAARRQWVHYMASAGLLSAFLMADDMWLLHDRVLPGRIGIPEIVVYTAYAVVTFGHLWIFRRLIMRTEYQVLFLAGFLLACSLVADTLTNNVAASNAKYLTEDGPKLFGMITWLTYHARTAMLLLTQQLRPDRHAAVDTRRVAPVAGVVE